MNLRTVRCRRCGAAIVWARTTGDRPMPLDPGENPAGNVFVTTVNGLPVATVATKDGPRPKGVQMMPHWATCGPTGKTKKQSKPAAPAPPDLFDEGETA